MRDRFAFALRNLAAGRAWDDTGEEPVRAHGQPIQFFAVLYSLALLYPLRSPEAMLLCLFHLLAPRANVAAPLQEEEPTPLEALRAEVQRATGMGMGSDRSASSAVEQVRSRPWPSLTPALDIVLALSLHVDSTAPGAWRGLAEGDERAARRALHRRSVSRRRRRRCRGVAGAGARGRRNAGAPEPL
eukprot:COSAG04_NODE_733_length_10713_cov_8.864236_3_plen_187_part_00